MRKVFIALAFIAIIVNGTMLPEVRSKTRASIEKLQKTKFGKNVLAAIQLQLSSSNKSDIVDNILGLLNDLLNSTNDNLVANEEGLAQNIAQCNQEQAELNAQIDELNLAITAAETELPVQEHRLISLQEQLAVAENNLAVAQETLANEIAADAAAVEAHAVRSQQSDDFLNGLQEARALVSQLLVTSFVQKGSNIMIQLSDHRSSTLKALTNNKHKKLFNLLMQLSQDVSILADQSSVQNIIQIIDDLLLHEQSEIDRLDQLEADRIAAFNAAVANLNQQISTAENQITSLNGDIVNTQGRIDALVAEIAEKTSLRDGVVETLNENIALCESTQANYRQQIEELNDNLDAIRQVIAIFQGQAIQDVKPFVLAQLEN